MNRAALDALPWRDTPSSSNVARLAFVAGSPDDDTPGRLGELYVAFANGGVYRYRDVPAGDHQALLEADADPEQSVGTLFARTVRAGRRHERLTIEEDA